MFLYEWTNANESPEILGACKSLLSDMYCVFYNEYFGCSKFGVMFKARAQEREEILAACKSLLHECEKMLHFICGKTALDDVREKLELVSDTSINGHSNGRSPQCANI